MSLSDEVLQKLACSNCKKYLSVFPVKVYPNRKVRCGRCSEDNDNGTHSALFQTVAKYLKFPCINRFEGCREVLLSSDMEKHEDVCFEDDYVCPLCPNFNGSAYRLQHHLKITHPKAFLENMDFLIELDNGSHENIYFYCKNNLLIILVDKYEAHLQELHLKLDLIGKNQRNLQNVLHKFYLFTIKNKLTTKRKTF